MHRHRHWHTRTLSQSAQAASKFFRATTATRLRLRLRQALIDRSPRNSFSNWARSAERQQLCAAQSSVAPAETALPTAKAAPHSAAAATATRHPNESKPSEWAPALTLSLSRLLSLSLSLPLFVRHASKLHFTLVRTKRECDVDCSWAPLGCLGCSAAWANAWGWA